VLVLGQTPPPWHGQAVMIQQIVDARFEQLDVVHVRMEFSETHAEIGRASVRKLAHLAALIARVRRVQREHGATVLYYPPAGGQLTAVLRDIALLTCLRGAFSHVVFHFHAAGVAEMQAQLPGWLRPLYRHAYEGVDRAILPSRNLPPDAARLKAKSIVIVPHGIPDEHPAWAELAARTRTQSRALQLLYVGMLDESKGVTLLVDALAELSRRGIHARLRLVGAFANEAYRGVLARHIAQRRLGDRIELSGVLIGPEKWRAYATADVLCLPTFYAAETFGLVALEAMQLELPVVATRWRALPEIVEHGETGLLVEPRDANALADALARLAQDPALRRTLGANGRARYLQRFGHERFLRELEAALTFSESSP
jgi:glycosyltransferase involved in cell wall biosynthesis